VVIRSWIWIPDNFSLPSPLRNGGILGELWKDYRMCSVRRRKFADGWVSDKVKRGANFLGVKCAENGVWVLFFGGGY